MSDDSSDIVDDVNALLKLRVGDQYRLEHIKLAFIENKMLWESDKKYLERMKEKYLTNLHTEEKVDTDENLETEADNAHTIHCWKCGKKNLLKANFCMGCGAALFDVGSKPKPVVEQTPESHVETPRKTIGLKIPIMIGIPVIVLAILGAGYSQGYFDSAFEKYESDDIDDADTKTSVETTTTSGETNSKCGKGTVFDPDTNACVLESSLTEEKKSTSGETNSKCGKGTVFDPETNACVLDN